MKKLEDELSAPDAIHATHDAIERMVVTEGHKILRAMLQQHYDLPASLEHDVAVKAHDRHRRERLRQSIRKLETLVGEVEVQRTLYQVEGVPYLAPLEGVLAMPAEKYSQEVRRFAAEESAKSSFDEVVELIAQRTGARVPKRQVEELTILSAQDFDAFDGARLREVEDTDHLLVLSFDGKGIAMRLADLREATHKKAEAARANRTRTRLASGSAPITSVADSHDISVEASIAWLRTPCVRFAVTVARVLPYDHATLGTDWVATPCRAGPSPAEALHEVSALRSSSSSVFIWRTVIGIAPVERDRERAAPI